jgi:drug/metabolite transporter (DMT)-like permease
MHADEQELIEFRQKLSRVVESAQATGKRFGWAIPLAALGGYLAAWILYSSYYLHFGLSLIEVETDFLSLSLAALVASVLASAIVLLVFATATALLRRFGRRARRAAGVLAAVVAIAMVFTPQLVALDLDDGHQMWLSAAIGNMLGLTPDCVIVHAVGDPPTGVLPRHAWLVGKDSAGYVLFDFSRDAPIFVSPGSVVLQVVPPETIAWTPAQTTDCR